MYQISKLNNTYYVIGKDQQGHDIRLGVSISSIERLNKRESQEILAADNSRSIEDPILEDIVDTITQNRKSTVLDYTILTQYLPLIYRGEIFNRVHARDCIDSFR